MLDFEVWPSRWTILARVPANAGRVSADIAPPVDHSFLRPSLVVLAGPKGIAAITSGRSLVF
ncbi:hypothetical protein CYLTODRAFT_427657 [Cylindrobasidium torrendii FP15055 ss-10]|uniref:Uncharacterized protein n=1 Tax=Cylindrobasidium torrendii FP15055 ss-10 TaxID=1314674 RepID=A0A0D7AT69_9AGAR|nr:hypothetical protein CYLTODRAFT_427657 [Cylindrobasidium torrendii FP15055 ss-10]